MPLHSAVYDPTRGKIFAVRGGRVFQFNETTLAKENEVQYAGPTLSDSYICYDSGRDKLWVTYSPSFSAPPVSAQPTNDKYIFKLDPTNLSLEQTIGIDNQNLESANPSFMCNGVIRHIRSNGVQLAFTINNESVTNGAQFVFFNPDALPGAIFTKIGIDGTRARWSFIEVRPSSTDYLLCSDDSFNNGVERWTNANGFVESSETYPTNGNQNPPNMTARIYGFAYCPDNNKHYCANRSNLILRLDASNGFGIGSAIDLGAVIDVWNVRRNPNNGFIYAPDIGGSNTIAVIDPSDDSFVLKSGFDAPWDVVFTASKAIAIQHSAEGLKEIV